MHLDTRIEVRRKAFCFHCLWAKVPRQCLCLVYPPPSVCSNSAFPCVSVDFAAQTVPLPLRVFPCGSQVFDLIKTAAVADGELEQVPLTLQPQPGIIMMVMTMMPMTMTMMMMTVTVIGMLMPML